MGPRREMDPNLYERRRCYDGDIVEYRKIYRSAGYQGGARRRGLNSQTFQIAVNFLTGFCNEYFSDVFIFVKAYTRDSGRPPRRRRRAEAVRNDSTLSSGAFSSWRCVRLWSSAGRLRRVGGLELICVSGY